MYLNSNEIRTFPNPRRNIEYIDDKIISEQNLSRIVKILSPNSLGTFLINVDYSAGIIEFCILGYYFKTSVWPSLEHQAATPLYAIINIDEINTPNELLGDVDNLYTGVSFDTWAEYQDVLAGKAILIGLWDTNGFLVNTSMLISNMFFNTVFFIDSAIDNKPATYTDAIYRRSLWVDVTLASKPVLRYYDNSSASWIKLGAVYK